MMPDAMKTCVQLQSFAYMRLLVSNYSDQQEHWINGLSGDLLRHRVKRT